MFINEILPGFEVGEYLLSLVPLFTANNPDATLQNMAIRKINDFCYNSTLTAVNPCDHGFIFDSKSGLCLISLNGTKNYWQANDECFKLGSELVGFDNDGQVQSILQLLNNGNFCRSWLFLTILFLTLKKHVCLAW
jgi:hypothetical protein